MGRVSPKGQKVRSPMSRVSQISNVILNRHVDLRRGDKVWKDDFQEAYNKVERSVQTLFHHWLHDPKSGEELFTPTSDVVVKFCFTDAEATEFAKLRVACLPEIVLAYNTVLDTSSRFLSRDLLLRGMDLAAVIAAENSDLGSCFIAADRMPELVDSFAYLSKTMIQADDIGPKGAKSKKKKNGENLGLWSVRAPSP